MLGQIGALSDTFTRRFEHEYDGGVGMSGEESPFACDMTAIEADQRGAHLETIKSLFGSIKEVSEMPNGYRFRLPNDSETLRRTSKFIALERLCCPFFGFSLEVEAGGGATWLSLTGREGVKPFILAEIGDYLTEIRSTKKHEHD